MSDVKTRPTLTVIVGSTRPVRIGDQIGEEVTRTLSVAVDAGVRVVDLRELALPSLDEPRPPALGQYVNPHTLQWKGLVDGSDAVVFVTPQYNGGYPGDLKNAIDYLYAEWTGKPVAIVSYGAHGGAQAVDQLTSVLTFMKMDLAPEAVQITVPQDAYGTDWRLTDPAAVIEPVREELSGLARHLLDRVLVAA